jgi:hypothetical protein
MYECKWHSRGRRFDPVQLHHLSSSTSVENTEFRQKSLIKALRRSLHDEHFLERVILEFHLAKHEFTGNDLQLTARHLRIEPGPLRSLTGMGAENLPNSRCPADSQWLEVEMGRKRDGFFSTKLRLKGTFNLAQWYLIWWIRF